MVMFILAVGLLLTGCEGKVTGGGWFMDGEDKCTFGFNAQEDDCCQAKGQFQFNDHANTKIHAVVYDLSYSRFSEEWTIRGKTKDGTERIMVKVEDNGEPGVGAGDYIKVWIYGADGGHWEGVLGGGNIQEHVKD